MKKHSWYSTLAVGLALLLVSSVIACGPPPTISVNPTSFTFDAEQGKANPPTQTLNISNSGGGTLDWSLSDSAAWLILNPSTGTSAGEIHSINLSVDVSGMNVGSYAATITVSAPGASNSPQTVPVNLTINPPPSEVWKTYTNYIYNYSIQYPSSWSVDESYPLITFIYAPTRGAFILVFPRPKEDMGLDEALTSAISYNKEQGFYYELISYDRITHQGVEARVIEYIFQSDEDSARYYSKDLNIKSGDCRYEVCFRASPSDYSSYSSVFDQALASFRIVD